MEKSVGTRIFLILGGSGSYKSTSLVILNILLASMTNVVLILRGITDARKLFKREVHRSTKVLNPHQSGRSDLDESFLCIFGMKRTGVDY